MSASVDGQRRSAPPGMTRIALFGSGSPTSTLALATLAARFDVALVVVPGGPRRGGVGGVLRRVGRWRSRRTLARAARRLGVPVHVSVKARLDGLVSTLHQHRVDLICVATFPHRIPNAVLRAVPLGAVGLHPSLLPRHRGPHPLFWTYHAGDPETGVSVFALDGGEDTGDVLAQEAVTVERGRPGIDLYHELARRGVALLARTVDALAAGTAARSPQVEALASREPAPAAGGVALADWDAERLWHFLCGAGGGFVVDRDGRRVLHGPVRRWSREPAGAPGDVQIVDAALRLYCREGWVDVERATLAMRLRGALRRGVRA
jgi:methionyl-tRNA formyltransferase